MIDVGIFSMDLGLHHLINFVFQMANALLMFLVFRLMTGKTWQSAFISALFALHFLYLQSVAWVSEQEEGLPENYDGPDSFVILITRRQG